MTVQFNITSDVLNLLHSHQLTLEDAFVMICIKEDKTSLVSEYLRDFNSVEIISYMENLVDRGFLAILAEQRKFILNAHGLQVVAQIQSAINAISVVAQATRVEEQRSQLDQLVTEYLELFPMVKGNGGKTLRSNFQDTKKKMTKFMINYRYDRDTIIRATRSFIEGFRGNYAYCPVAEYFIMKDGSSQLATECDRVMSGGDQELINPFERRM